MAIDRCVEEDIPQIAEIHAELFFRHGKSSKGLRSYYRDMFFHNPWYDSKLSPLVYRSKEGKVIGCIGVIPRTMNMMGRKVRVAVAHRLMVDPGSHSPLAALKLVRAFLSGPQDLSISDGANNLGRKFWEGMGGRTAYLYSMNWICPLRPCCYVNSLLREKKRLGSIAYILKPACLLADSISAHSKHNPFRHTPPDTFGVEADAETLLSCIAEFSKGYSLCPEYDLVNFKWLLDFLRQNTHRGKLKGFAVRNKKNALIGAFLYYLNSKNFAEVMLLAARDNEKDAVLKHLLYHAWQQGAVALFGRLEPKFLESLYDNNCFIKRGSWALVHSRDTELVNIINRGDAFITALDGELWLRSPKDIL
ncbi:MAG: hypothetical protein KAT56_00645 [Sedimentisphaerales bacterium]|nr:hypothetical protein [Sedimentisphaerales bacterium]